MLRDKSLFLILFMMLFSCKGQSPSVDLTTVKTLDIERYLGTWYEIARYDHRFERGLMGVTASYSWREDGKIKVVNAGYRRSLDGRRSEAVGKAYIPDPDVPAKLKVSFFAFFYGDYFVLELDEDYRWAAVGSSSDKYLWILSRTPQMEDAIYDDLLEKLTLRGYDVSKLIQVEQRINLAH
ncbi:MAG: lipocalin family protein [Bacteroides sp.]|jgi:lipocalin|nr:lipocalin family protein [Bacteroides sp.]